MSTSVDFVALDVETANPDLASICQIGIASFRDGSLVDTWESLVNPAVEFSAINVSIHGVTERLVRGAPTWKEIFPKVSSLLHGRIVVSHTPFDRIALLRACERFNLAESHCSWLDSARVVRMALPEFSKSGYGLSNLASCFGIEYQAHNALEDARCAGLVFVRAVLETGIQPNEWLDHMSYSAPSEHGRGNWVAFPPPVRREGNPSGPLFGEVIVFTGSLGISRSEAAENAAAAGCRVDDGVTKHTTILVVGDQDLRLLAGHDKSSKHLKAEMLIGKGQQIRIICESEFMNITSHCSVATA
jgi:DNA polymerase-3 subunit epsilon